MSGEAARERLTAELCDIALAAGARILEIYGRDFAVHEKADLSPVTEADQAAEQLILERLARLTPEIPIVAEESVAAGRVPDVSGGRFWLVDPLDGTKEFISRNGEFTVNVALIEETAPVAGVVYAPARAALYYADGPGRAFRRSGKGAAEPISVREPPADGLDVVASRSHRDARTDEYLEAVRVRRLVPAGSSLKFCLLAAGEADLYPRLGPTMEWDTAAGHAVLAAAGGTVRTLEGGPFVYGKPDFRNPFFVARGRET